MRSFQAALALVVPQRKRRLKPRSRFDADIIVAVLAHGAQPAERVAFFRRPCLKIADPEPVRHASTLAAEYRTLQNRLPPFSCIWNPRESRRSFVLDILQNRVYAARYRRNGASAIQGKNRVHAKGLVVLPGLSARRLRQMVLQFLANLVNRRLLT